MTGAGWGNPKKLVKLVFIGETRDGTLKKLLKPLITGTIVEGFDQPKKFENALFVEGGWGNIKKFPKLLVTGAGRVIEK